MKRTISLLLFALVFVFACNDKKTDDENIKTDDSTVVTSMSVRETLPFDVEFSNYNFVSSNDNQITTDRGTQIIIPSNAFVYTNGNDYTGDVVLSIREITSPAQIIAADVDMGYDTAGISGVFQTAGMFEIKATGNGQELQLKNGKEIEVNFMSTSGGQFNFYKYDDATANWSYKSTSYIKNVDQPVNPSNLMKPVKLDPSNDYLIQVEVDYGNFPEINSYKNILWKYSGDMSPDEVGKIVKQKFSEVSLEKSGKEFIMVLAIGNKKTRLEVEPVFKQSDYNNALNSYNASANNSTQAGQYVRTNKISSLGLFNYDFLYHNSDSRTISLEFKNGDNTIDNMILFQITGNNNAVIRNQIQGRFSFMYSPNMVNKIIGLLPNKQVVYLSNKDFNSQIKDNPSSLSLMEYNQEITSEEELENLISSL